MKVTSLGTSAYTWLLVKVKLAVVAYIVVFCRISLIQFLNQVQKSHKKITEDFCNTTSLQFCSVSHVIPNTILEFVVPYTVLKKPTRFTYFNLYIFLVLLSLRYKVFYIFPLSSFWDFSSQFYFLLTSV